MRKRVVGISPVLSSKSIDINFPTNTRLIDKLGLSFGIPEEGPFSECLAFEGDFCTLRSDF